MHMTGRTSKVDSYIDHEGPVAEAYKWWGVYLIREQRRLQAIADAIAEPVEVADTSLDDTQPIIPGAETPDGLLTRVDAELGIEDALSELEGIEEEESKTRESSARDEKTISDRPEKRKSSGRAALLGRKKAEEDF